MHDKDIKAKKQMISLFILFLLIAITCYIYLRDYSYQELITVLSNANYIYLLIGLGLMLLFITCEAINILLIMRVLGQKTTLLRSYEYSGIGFYFSSITPSASGGQPAQIYYMNRDKIPLNISSIAIFFIVFVYQIAMLLMGGVLAVFRYRDAINFITKLKLLFFFGVTVNTFVVFLLFSLMFSKKLLPSIALFILKAAKRLRIIKNADIINAKLEQSLVSYQEKAQVLKAHPLLFFQVLFVTIIQMIAINLIPAFVYLSMGNQGKRLIDLVTYQSLLTISVSAVPLPGAEGVTQGGFLQVFNVFFPADKITCAMLINRSISFYIPLVICFLLYLFTYFRIAKQNGVTSIEK